MGSYYKIGNVCVTKIDNGALRILAPWTLLRWLTTVQWWKGGLLHRQLSIGVIHKNGDLFLGRASSWTMQSVSKRHSMNSALENFRVWQPPLHRYQPGTCLHSLHTQYTYIYIYTYFPAHKTRRDFFVRNFRKNNERILILVLYWKKTGLLHTKISNHNIIYSS